MIKERQFRIGIIGAGSIGSLFGGYLAQTQSERYKIDVVFFGRENHIKSINKQGLLLIREDDEIKITTNIKGYTGPEEYLEDNREKRFRFCFLTTKTYDIEKTLKQYNEIIKDTDHLIILQNGIGNEDLVKNYIPESKIIRAITSNGAFLTKPGRIKHTGKGFTKIGYPFQGNKNGWDEGFDNKNELKILKDLLTNAGIATTISKDIISACWEKIFVNIGINPFGALTRLRNGELLKNEDIKSLMGAAITEAISVALRKGIDVSEGKFIDLTYSVARKTENNINSMLQDILKGKQTEIDFINGKIVQYAQEMGISVPINRTLTYLIKGLERSEL